MDYLIISLYQINGYGPSNPLTALVPRLGEVDPDEAFSSVPYEKGCALLCYLESLLGQSSGCGLIVISNTHCNVTL